MDRSYLKYLLNAGPSRVLDVRRQCMENGLDPLFRTQILNNSILLKQTPSGPEADELPRIATKIFLPYDRTRPEEGGESFFFSPSTFRAALAGRMGEKNINPDHLAMDTDLLKLFDHIPSFSPYLMRDALERASRHIPDGYFSIPDREAASIKQRMRARLRPLVASAYSGSGGKSIDKFSENAIEQLAEKLWELKDMTELMPLIKAFRIQPDEAPKIFYCWLGIAFFESEYLKLQPRLQKFAQWLAAKSQPREILPKELKDMHQHATNTVKMTLQDQWKRSLHILQEYTASYDELVGEKASATRFIAFLSNSSNNFWTLGGCLGRLEQSVETWEQICGRFDFEALTFERLTTLFELLNQINAGTGAAKAGVTSSFAKAV